MTMIQLSEGSLAAIINGGNVQSPIFQMLCHKKIISGTDQDRYRLILSDGINMNSFAILGSQLNEKIISGELIDKSIIRINHYVLSDVQNSSSKGRNKFVLIILDLTVLIRGHDTVIGNPVALGYISQAGSSSTVLSEKSTVVISSKTCSTTGDDSFANRRDSNVVDVSDDVNVSDNINNNNNNDDDMFTAAYCGDGSYNSVTVSSNVGDVYNSSVTVSRPIARVDFSTYPISSLNPFQCNHSIKAEVIRKYDVHIWNKKNSKGKLFSVDLTDESGSIKAVAFNEDCDKFYNLLETGKTYIVNNFSVKPANEKFNMLNHAYELILMNSTELIETNNDRGGGGGGSSLLSRIIRYNFRSFDSLKNVRKGSLIDVIGVCYQFNGLQHLASKVTGTPLKKRNINLTDENLTSIVVSLWGGKAEQFDGSASPVVAIKAGRVDEYAGCKSVSVNSCSSLEINPDIPETVRLKCWFNSSAASLNNNISELPNGGMMVEKLLTIRQAYEYGLGTKRGKVDYFNVQATILDVQQPERAFYQACPNVGCQKKVTATDNGYRCDKCRRDFTACKYRLILTMQIGDFSGLRWVTIFNDEAESLLQATVEEIVNNSDQPDVYFGYFKRPLFKTYVFKIQAKSDRFAQKHRVQMIIVDIKPVNYSDACKRILDKMQ